MEAKCIKYTQKKNENLARVVIAFGAGDACPAMSMKAN
jgi:hypothetical protein